VPSLVNDRDRQTRSASIASLAMMRARSPRWARLTSGPSVCLAGGDRPSFTCARSPLNAAITAASAHAGTKNAPEPRAFPPGVRGYLAQTNSRTEQFELRLLRRDVADGEGGVQRIRAPPRSGDSQCLEMFRMAAQLLEVSIDPVNEITPAPSKVIEDSTVARAAASVAGCRRQRAESLDSRNERLGHESRCGCRLGNDGPPARNAGEISPAITQRELKA